MSQVDSADASRVTWFAAGALAAAAAVALFLFADGYFEADASLSAQADGQRTIIEGKQ
ncbi:hypothetical protein KEU06_02295 [Pseudaminobacter sp. 19-2017]|uniref:Uncharacterized protein n=1 Tax=Pseudaminobacter soli (ex Zhang et al. 2022) TaxID=2831468 RepID=A0A942DUS7_9HYPH|nr:hypothetical protein [Pseudaminobacter soli]MBS3647454.1 hypothetical protein [Pseudaminobacter soli]